MNIDSTCILFHIEIITSNLETNTLIYFPHDWLCGIKSLWTLSNNIDRISPWFCPWYFAYIMNYFQWDILISLSMMNTTCKIQVAWIMYVYTVDFYVSFSHTTPCHLPSAQTFPSQTENIVYGCICDCRQQKGPEGRNELAEAVSGKAAVDFILDGP